MIKRLLPPILAAAILLIANVASLPHYPMSYCDEASHIHISDQFLQTGRFSRVFMGPMNPLSETVVMQGRLYQAARAIWQAAFGPGLLAGRLFSTLGWLVAAALVYHAGRRLYDQVTGLLAAALFATSLNVFYASHLAREETWAAAAVLVVLLAYLALSERPTPGRFARFGLLGVVALDVHPVTVWLTLPLAALAVHDHARSGPGRRGLLAGAGAGAAALAALVIVHLLPDPAAAIRSLALSAGNNELIGLPALAGLAGQLAYLKQVYVAGLNFTVLPFTLAAIAGVVAAAQRRGPSDRLLLFMLAASMTLFALAMPHKNPRYGVLWDPLAALLIAAAVVRLAPRLEAHLPVRLTHRAPWLIAAPLIALHLAVQGWLAVRFAGRDTGSYYQEVRALIAPGEPVLADVTLWYAFRDRNPFTADWALAQTSRLLGPQPSWDTVAAAFVEAVDPVYVVDDGSVGCSVDVDPLAAAYSAYLRDACRQVGQVDDPWFGAGGQIGQGGPTLVYICRAPGAE